MAVILAGIGMSTPRTNFPGDSIFMYYSYGCNTEAIGRLYKVEISDGNCTLLWLIRPKRFLQPLTS